MTETESHTTIGHNTDGLGELQARVTRRSRSVPPPRRPREETPAPKALPTSRSKTPQPVSPVSPSVSPSSAIINSQPNPALTDEPAQGVTLPANEAQANLAVRVRQSLDERLSDLVYALRKQGIRSSKTEIIEMLLEELPMGPTEELGHRLDLFRAKAPRSWR